MQRRKSQRHVNAANARWRAERAQAERDAGIPFDLRPAGGGNYEVVPIAGLTKWTLRDAETHEEKTRGTMKQILRWLSRDTVHMLPFDAFH